MSWQDYRSCLLSQWKFAFDFVFLAHMNRVKCNMKMDPPYQEYMSYST